MLIQAKKRTLLVGIVIAMLTGVYLGIYAGNLHPPGCVFCPSLSPPLRGIILDSP